MSRIAGYVSRNFRAMMTRKAPRARTVRAMNALGSDPPVGGRAAGCVLAAALVGATAELVVGPVGAVVGAVVATVVAVDVGGACCVMAKGELASVARVPPATPPVASTKGRGDSDWIDGHGEGLRHAADRVPIATDLRAIEQHRAVRQLVRTGAQREGCEPGPVHEADGDRQHGSRLRGRRERCSCLHGSIAATRR